MHIKYFPLGFVGVILSFTGLKTGYICNNIVMLAIAFIMYVKQSHSIYLSYIILYVIDTVPIVCVDYIINTYTFRSL